MRNADLDDLKDQNYKEMVADEWKEIRAMNEKKPVTTNWKEWQPPTKHADLKDKTTMRLVDELIFRLKSDEETYKICPSEFTELKIAITDARGFQ